MVLLRLPRRACGVFDPVREEELADGEIGLVLLQDGVCGGLGEGLVIVVGWGGVGGGFFGDLAHAGYVVFEVGFKGRVDGRVVDGDEGGVGGGLA